MAECIGTYTYKVESFHLDCTERLSFAVLGNQLLNAAARHAESYGFGREALRQRDLAWVFSRLLIQMDKPLREFDTYTVQTWVVDATRWFSHRNFAILDAEGNAVGYASSVWALMDLATRKAADISLLLPGYSDIVCPEGTAPDCPLERTRRPIVTTAEPALVFRPLFCDIDYNGHFNSIRYIEHLLDALPMDVCRNHPIRRIEINYNAECHYGEVLAVYVATADDGEYDAEIRKEDGSVSCRCKVLFALNSSSPNGLSSNNK